VARRASPQGASVLGTQSTSDSLAALPQSALSTPCGHTAPAPSLTLDDVGRDDPWPDAEHVRVVRIDADLDPMMVGAAEGLKPGEVLDRRKNGRAGYSRGQRLVSPEKVTVAMDEEDRLCECDRLLRAAGQAWVENEESLTRAAIIDRPLLITSGPDFRTIQACPKDPPLRQW
jgi:hypothetical protein